MAHRINTKNLGKGQESTLGAKDWQKLFERDFPFHNKEELIEIYGETEGAKQAIEVRFPAHCKPLYESRSRAERKSNVSGNIDLCLCCQKQVKEAKQWVHINTAFQVLRNDIDDAQCKPLTGHESQGFFPVGGCCAKKVGAAYVHTA